jgi:NitT/TauT family transport system substrate-binding protein
MGPQDTQPPRRTRPFVVLSLWAVGCVALLSAGCGKDADKGRPRVKVAYLGLTCEAPLFVAAEKGFYEEEGLDAELVRTDWNGLREGLGTGAFQANHTLIMYLLQPIAEGLDVRITGGVHTGCLRLHAGKDSDVKKVEDLKGRKVGVPTHLYSPPHMFATRVLAAHGLDPKTDVTWLPMKPDVLGAALENKQVDAVATTDPIGIILMGAGLVRTIADQALDAPYKDEYCCVVVVSGEWADANPAAAAKVTRAILKASRWVQTNPTAAAELSVEKNYLASNAKLNAQAIAKLNYVPAVDRCRRSISSAADAMKKAGLLRTEISTEELTKRAWLDLDGVTDEWLEGLRVEQVAGGGPPPPMTRAEYLAFLGGPKENLACCCCQDNKPPTRAVGPDKGPGRAAAPFMLADRSWRLVPENP